MTRACGYSVGGELARSSSARVRQRAKMYIDIAMVDCNLVLMSHFLSTYADTGEHAPRAGLGALDSDAFTEPARRACHDDRSAFQARQGSGQRRRCDGLHGGQGGADGVEASRAAVDDAAGAVSRGLGHVAGRAGGAIPDGVEASLAGVDDAVGAVVRGPGHVAGLAGGAIPVGLEAELAGDDDRRGCRRLLRGRRGRRLLRGRRRRLLRGRRRGRLLVRLVRGRRRRDLGGRGCLGLLVRCGRGRRLDRGRRRRGARRRGGRSLRRHRRRPQRGHRRRDGRRDGRRGERGGRRRRLRRRRGRLALGVLEGPVRTLFLLLGPLAAGGATLLRLDVLRAVLRAVGLGVVVGDVGAEALRVVGEHREREYHLVRHDDTVEQVETEGTGGDKRAGST